MTRARWENPGEEIKMSGISGINSDQRNFLAGESNFKIDLRPGLENSGNVLGGQAGKAAASPPEDRVSISEEGRQAAAAFRAEDQDNQKASPKGGLEKPEEGKDDQGAAGPEMEEGGNARPGDSRGPAGQRGPEADGRRANLEKQLEALQKKAAELKKEIDKLKGQSGGDECAASEVKEKESEQRMLKARIQQLSQQLKSLDSGQDDSKAEGQGGAAA